VLFLLFMPLYSLLRKRRWQATVFVVLFSLFFYYKSSGLFVLMLGATSLFDWLLSRIIARPGAGQALRRCCVAASLTASLGILAYLKYANFFLWNLSALTGENFQPLDLLLPVGISFYTFQSISYIIDVYKGRVAPTRTWLEYAFFLSFFPALVAGPIVRADYFLPQIRANRHASQHEVYSGLWLIISGVIKKAVIADYIAQYNDLIFDAPGAYSGFETLMGIIGYTMQIYCDFSGYSDMAIGIALIMGFRLAPNFDFPYKSRNVGEFWHRWHISLSSWLRDYVYIPLGGNQKGTARTYLNNFITMLVGGLWHGAAWKFVFWGAMHGAGLAVILPAWMTFMAHHSPCKGAQLSRRVFGVTGLEGNDTGAALEGISRLKTFFKSLGLPVTMEELGIKDPDIDLLEKKLHENKGDEIGGYYRLRSPQTTEIYNLAR